MQIEACGTANLYSACCKEEKQIPVRDVQYIPGLSTNLLSVVQIVKRGYSVLFDSSGCKVMNADGGLVATGVIENDLFKLDQLKPTGSAMLSSCEASIEVWHKRLGHLNISSVKKLSNGLVNGVQVNARNDRDCRICPMGKQARIPFSKNGSRAKELLEVVHSDISGPMEEASFGGSRYYVSFIDDKSRRIFVYFLKSKSGEEVLNCFREFHAQAERQTGLKLKTLRTDNGKEYMNSCFQEYLKRTGIKHQTTNDYTPEQNGLAERANRTIVERARYMLFEAKLSKSFWAEAVATAVYLINRSPTRGHDLTPDEVWSGRKPNLSHVRIFGTKAMVQVPKKKRRKWDPKAKECILTGFEEETKGYRLYDPTSKIFLKSREVQFLDEMTDSCLVPVKKRSTVQLEFDEQPEPIGIQPVSGERDDSDTYEDEFEDSLFNITTDTNVTVLPSRQTSNPPWSQVLRRSGREHALPGKYKDFSVNCKGLPVSNSPQASERCSSDFEGFDDDVPKSGLDSGFSGVATDDDRRCLAMEPKTFGEAISSSNADEWRKAMEDEFNSIQANETWTLVDLPPGRKAVGCKWVFKLKHGADGQIARFKARLVAQGYSQQYGSDYDEVFAPVVRQTTFRTLMAVAAKQRMIVKQYDVKTAFLNGDLQEEIYMRQPPGYVSKGNERKVCKLKKSLYGLKQAARSWNRKLNDELVRNGFECCRSDPCLYRKQFNGRWCYVLVYVDDLIVASEDPRMIEELAESLGRCFELSSLGDIHFYLGMEVEKDKAGDFLLNQRKYIGEILKTTGLQDAKPSSIPLDPGYVKKEDDGNKLPDNVEYQKLIGKLLFVAVNTRPDISTAVSLLSRKTSNPSQADWTELKRVVRYLKGTKDFKLRLSRNGGPNAIVGYSDADWAENRQDRKSNSGFIFKINGGTVSWACRKQSCVSLSTAEAEFIALSEAVQEAIWLKSLLKDLNEKQEITIHVA